MQHGRGLKLGTLIAGEWRIERLLGEGGFGVIAETFGVHETTIYRCLTALEAKPLRAA